MLVIGAGVYFLLQTQDRYTAVEDQATDDVVHNPPGEEAPTDEADTPNDTTYIEGKTPAQYEGQTENGAPANSAEYGNEQFRIPEGQ